MLNWYNLPSDWLNQSSFWCYWKWPSIYQKYQNIKWNDNTLVIFASQRFSVHSAPHKQGLLLPLSGSCITDTYKLISIGSSNANYQSHRMPPRVAQGLSLMIQTFPQVLLVISGSLQSYPQQFHKEYSLQLECALVLCL